MEIRAQRPSIRVLIAVSLLAMSMVSTGARTQGEPQPVVNLHLNLTDPGARSLGLGGAFIALADDATAAFSNPAGLVQLARPEISLEGRRTSYSTPFTVGGRAEGEPSGIGLDTTIGLRTARSNEVVSGLSFLSVAYPRDKWSVAFFRHQLADLRFFGETQGLFGGGTDCCQLRFFDQRTSNDFDFVSYGISGAYRVSEAFSLGLGVVYLDASLTEISDAFWVDEDSLESVFAFNSYRPERWIFGGRSFVDDSAWTLSGGFLWTASRRWRIGGVYRQGPELETGRVLVAGELIDFGVPPGSEIARTPRLEAQFPSVWGLGFAFRAPGERLTVSFQWDRIEFSSIVESLSLDDQTIEDADELHIGGEYVLRRSGTLVALRLGAWLDPDHQLRATTEDPFIRALLPPGDDEMHYTAGFGVAFTRFQLDVGADLSDRVDVASVSVVYTF